MVYTVTLNPSLDYVVHCGDFEDGKLNRTEHSEIQFGGKGINVSTVLHHLGVETIAMGFIAGFTGTALADALHKSGIRTDLIELDEGLTRINVKIKSGQETEINASGPDIPQSALDTLLQKLDQLSAGDVLVLAGSIPPSLPHSIYRQILSRLEGRGVLSVVDTTGKTLCEVLSCRPFLIKPNVIELGELFGRDLSTDEEIISCAAALQERGARNVLVSMAGDGSILLDEAGQAHRLPAPEGKVRNSVGAGDSMVAGFLAGWLLHGNYDAAHRMGTAAGSASAFSDTLATKEQIYSLLDAINAKYA